MWPSQQPYDWRVEGDVYNMHPFGHALPSANSLLSPHPPGFSTHHGAGSGHQPQYPHLALPGYLPELSSGGSGQQPMPHAQNLNPHFRPNAWHHPHQHAWKQGNQAMPASPARPMALNSFNPNWQHPRPENLDTASRGPPLKPKRSGHAIWVGNLHPATLIVELKDHFSQGATEDIESVFLISRSSCAFVNYRSEQACKNAQSRFHSSRLRDHVLVCRLRRDLESADGRPTSSSKTVPDGGAGNEDESTDEPQSPVIVESPSSVRLNSTALPDPSRVKIPAKFFILKSLTMQDLDASVYAKTWTTQPHNEYALSKAYEQAKDVYLIFSANKSREYFGFARMASAISATEKNTFGDEAGASSQRSLQTLPRSTPTPATSSAPQGRIVDDSARGTLFWEADLPDDVEYRTQTLNNKDKNDNVEDTERTFQVEWLSLTRVPFFRTRGLRNPWNANREVKIARDGTELEPVVGRQLLNLFNSHVRHDWMASVYN